MHRLSGSSRVPGSKSHTIRALLIAALAEDGESVLINPLVSQDTLSAVAMVQQFGAKVAQKEGVWLVSPISDRSALEPITVNVGNSGTSLYLGTAAAALLRRRVRFTGDASIQKRSAAKLLRALENLGVTVIEEAGNGCCPYSVQGPILGGKTSLAAPTSQYLSALLLTLPLSLPACHSTVELELLNEHPYVDMTLAWLDSQQIFIQHSGYESYTIEGGQHYRAFRRQLPADFSSATFLLCAAAITASSIRLLGLEPNDSQGDKEVLDYLVQMGCSYQWQDAEGTEGAESAEGAEHILEFHGATELQAVELDLSRTPDALPALAVTCCCASGRSLLHNVAHARAKETDRIHCMAVELQALGFKLEERPDGLEISGSKVAFLSQAQKRAAEGLRHLSRSYDDHRIIMSLSLLNLLGPALPVELDDSSYVDVTFPGFFEELERLCSKP